MLHGVDPSVMGLGNLCIQKGYGKAGVTVDDLELTEALMTLLRHSYCRRNESALREKSPPNGGAIALDILSVHQVQEYYNLLYEMQKEIHKMRPCHTMYRWRQLL